IETAKTPSQLPRHATWGFLVYPTIITPLLLLIGLWKQGDANGVRIYLFASAALILLLFPFMFGMASVAWLEPGGLQRLFAIATFVPVGVVGYFFKRKPRLLPAAPPESVASHLELPVLNREP